MDQALTVMRRDLQCAVTPTNGTSKVLSGDFRVGNVTSPGVSQPVAIEMFTATGALRDNAPWGDIQRVTYELRDPDRPQRRRQGFVPQRHPEPVMAVTTPDVEDQWMLSGVQSIEFSCFDGSQWQDTWDTTGVTSVNTNLPLAVRVRHSNGRATTPRRRSRLKCWCRLIRSRARTPCLSTDRKLK